MNPTTPATPGSAMSQGGTFIRPGAVGWGLAGNPQPDADRTAPAVIEHALDAAVKDPDRVTDLLDELSRGRVWLPLPEDRPVTDGSAVLLPTGVGIALNPGAKASVPIYPEDVGYLAATLVVTDGVQVRMGRPPADPVTLLSEVRTALGSIPDVSQASRAWLSVPGQGEGLVISVTLLDPAAESARQDVLSAIEQAVRAVPAQGFPIDVTFPGEDEPDQLDEWISAHAEPFYIRP